MTPAPSRPRGRPSPSFGPSPRRTRELPLDTQRVHDTLAAVRVRVGESPQPDRVQVASPLQVRARALRGGVRVRAPGRRSSPPGGSGGVPARRRPARDPACLQHAALPARGPAGARALPVLRVRLACRAPAGAELAHQRRGGRSRSALVLRRGRVPCSPVWRSSARTRSLADVTWSLDAAPTEAEWERAVARQGPALVPAAVGPVTAPAASAAARLAPGRVGQRARELRGLPGQVAGGERAPPGQARARSRGDGPRLLRAQGARGHLPAAARATGSRRVTPDNLAEAERILLAALSERRGEFLLSPNQTRVRAAVRRLEFDLLRYLRHEAASDSLFEPEHLELAFGIDGLRAARARAGGRHPRAGRDRPRGHLGRATPSCATTRAARWTPTRKRSGRASGAAGAAVHARRGAGVPRPAGRGRRVRAARRHQSKAPRAPGGGPGRRARRRVHATRTSSRGPSFEERTARVRRQVAEVAGRMRSGELASCPDTCAYRGGCSYPSICRAEG